MLDVAKDDIRALMLQIGRNARAAKKIIKRSGWGKPGLTWTPGTVDDPFGHDDDDYED